MNFVYLRSYMLKLFAFCLDSCIVNKAEKFVHVLGTWGHLEGVPIGSDNFWKVWCRAGLMGRSNRPQAVRWQVGGLTAQCRRSNRPRQGEKDLAPCCIPMLHRCIGSGGVCFGSGGACICAGGALCVIRALVWWFVPFAWAWFCLGCVEPMPLPKGSEICSSWSDLALCLSLAFYRLLEFLFSRFFSFLFLVGYQIMCVVNALIKGEIEDHVWFEDWWMVASWCDEWLTTLCGLTLC
jgi:hypothetical protein